jgi:hypothetical protein
MQSVTHNVTSDVTKIQDPRNNAVARVNSNPGETVTLKYYSFDANAPSGSGAIGWIDTGVMFTIAANAGFPSAPVTGSNWVCDSINYDFSFNTFAEVTLNASRNPGITV